MEGRYSTRSPAVKRLMREAQELCEPTDQYFAQPLEDNLFEWHFTIRGPQDSDFQAGVYHGRIILPVDYPMKPPSIIWLTPNGRFETNKKICLSISGHHPESWQPSWSIRTALLAIIGFMPTHPSGAIGSLDYKPEERKTLAKKSRDWKCPVCGDVSEILLEPNPESIQTSQEAKELAAQISFQGEKPKSPDTKSPQEVAVTSSSSPPYSTATVPSTGGVSNNASICMPSSAPANQLPSQGASLPNPGIFTPWSCPSVAPTYPSTIPPPFLFYPWNAPGLTFGESGSSILSQIPRFPFPPSHYAGNAYFHPTGFVIPPGLGMFPGSFPPPPQGTAKDNLTNPGNRFPVSINNSSTLSPPKIPKAGSVSHSPNSPGVSNIPPPSPVSVVSSSSPPPTSNSLPCPTNCAALRGNVLGELLSKVKRAGSDVEAQPRDHTETVTLATHDQNIESNAQSSNKPAIANEASVQENSQIIAGENHRAHVESVPGLSVFVLRKKFDGKSGDVLLQGRDEDSDLNHSTGFQSHTSEVVNIQTISEVLIRAFDVVDKSAEVPDYGGSGAEKVPQDVDLTYIIGDNNQVENKVDNSQETDTDDSSMRKESPNESTGKEISHSELLADIEEENAGSGTFTVEMSETEHKSMFERNTSSSMPDLKKKLLHGTQKGLRQRQSATAQIPSDVTGDETNSLEQATSGSGRQRIEAVAGDSTSVNHQRFPNDPAGNNAGHNHANEVQNDNIRPHGRQAHSTYDVSYLVMVGLCMTTVFIILNRLFFNIDLSRMFN